MQVINAARLAKLEAKAPQQFTPLEQVTNPTVTTNAAAHYLDRKAQTLRIWACYETAGPLRPIRINGRLAWKTDDIRKLLGVA